MSWKDKMKEFGGGDITFLSEDGETTEFIVVGEPVLLEGKFKGRPSDKIGCPVVTVDGYQLFIMGKRPARKLAKYEDQFSTMAFRITRHGVAGDIEAKYPVEFIADKEKVAALRANYDEKELAGMIAESIEAAQEMMKG